MLTSLIVAAVLAASPVAVKPAQGRGSKTMHVSKGGHAKAVHASHHSRRH